MPEVFREQGFVFSFYSNEGNEPLHIHVRRAGGFAKFWLEPLSLDYSQSLNPRELSKAESLIEENMDRIRRAWDEVFHT